MTRALLLAAAILLLPACAGQQPNDPVPDLKEARALLDGGKLAEGLVRMSELLGSVATLGDWRGHLARARILTCCFDAGAVEFLPKVAPQSQDLFKDLAVYASSRATLATAIAESWVGVLSGSSTPEGQLEAARGLADSLRRKLDHPGLRMIQKELLDCPSGEEMYRRLTLESIVDGERYALGRVPPTAQRDPARLAAALDQLAASYGKLRELEDVEPVVRAAWKEAGERCTEEAVTVRRDPRSVTAVGDTRRLLEADARGQVDDAGRFAQKATEELTRRSSRERVVAQIDESLRRYLLLIETQTGRNFPVTSVYDAIRFWCGKWKESALKEG